MRVQKATAFSVVLYKMMSTINLLRSSLEETVSSILNRHKVHVLVLVVVAE